MKKLGYIFAALAVALTFSGGSAEAAKRTRVVVAPAPWYAGGWWGWWASQPWTVRDPKLAASNFWVGAGATGAYYAVRSGHSHGGSAAAGGYAVTSAACAIVSPIIGTIVTQR